MRGGPELFHARSGRTGDGSGAVCATGRGRGERYRVCRLCAGPVGIDVRDWRGLSERIADHEDVRLQQLQNPEPVEDL